MSVYSSPPRAGWSEAGVARPSPPRASGSEAGVPVYSSPPRAGRSEAGVALVSAQGLRVRGRSCARPCPGPPGGRGARSLRSRFGPRSVSSEPCPSASKAACPRFRHSGRPASVRGPLAQCPPQLAPERRAKSRCWRCAGMQRRTEGGRPPLHLRTSRPPRRGRGRRRVGRPCPQEPQCPPAATHWLRGRAPLRLPPLAGGQRTLHLQRPRTRAGSETHAPTTSATRTRAACRPPVRRT